MPADLTAAFASAIQSGFSDVAPVKNITPLFVGAIKDMYTRVQPDFAKLSMLRTKAIFPQSVQTP
jgi:hypothetical protein